MYRRYVQTYEICSLVNKIKLSKPFPFWINFNCSSNANIYNCSLIQIQIWKSVNMRSSHSFMGNHINVSFLWESEKIPTSNKQFNTNYIITLILKYDIPQKLKKNLTKGIVRYLTTNTILNNTCYFSLKEKKKTNIFTLT